MIDGGYEVSGDSFNGCPMRGLRFMYELTNLVN